MDTGRIIFILPKTPWQRFKTRLKYWGRWKWEWWIRRQLGDRTTRIIIYHTNFDNLSIDEVVCSQQMTHKTAQLNWKWVDRNLDEMKRQTKTVEIPPRFGVPEGEEP